MPHYVDRTTGVEVFPDQIRSGEVTDFVQVRDSPGRALDPFQGWTVGIHFLVAVAAVVAAVAGASFASSFGEGGVALAVLSALAGVLVAVLATLPLYLLAHIGSVVWEIRQDHRQGPSSA